MDRKLYLKRYIARLGCIIGMLSILGIAYLASIPLFGIFVAIVYLTLFFTWLSISLVTLFAPLYQPDLNATMKKSFEFPNWANEKVLIPASNIYPVVFVITIVAAVLGIALLYADKRWKKSKSRRIIIYILTIIVILIFIAGIIALGSRKG